MEGFARVCCAVLLFSLPVIPVCLGGEGAWAAFHAKAEAGRPVTVVFFGGSLTWGANATDPNRTSWRGRMEDYLRARYPRAPIRCYDAAIGGTGSELGIYRLDRDVLARRPDLVFIDFAVNDNYFGTEPEAARCYETLIRRLVRADVAVMQVFLTVRQAVGPDYREDGRPRTAMYRRLAEAYRMPWVDVAPYVHAAADGDPGALDRHYPFEATHPDDSGYALFFEAVRDALDQALAAAPEAVLPDAPIYGEYTSVARRRLVDEPRPPPGWTREKAFRISLWYDGLPSRWMDDMLACSATAARTGAAWETTFEGVTVGVFGQMDAEGLGLRVFIDDRPALEPDTGSEVWTLNTAGFGGGRLFFWRRLAAGLPPGPHRLRLEPVAEEGRPDGALYIESLCSAE